MEIIEEIKKYPVLGALTIYGLMIVAVLHMKPRMLFHPDGTLRNFGIGNKNRTVFPFWFIAIAMGVVSYYIVSLIKLYY